MFEEWFNWPDELSDAVERSALDNSLADGANQYSISYSYLRDTTLDTPGSAHRPDLPQRPPAPRGPRSGRVLWSRPSTLTPPHPPVRRTPRPFPVPGDRRGPGHARGTPPCRSSSPSGLSLLIGPGWPPSLPRGMRCVPQLFHIDTGPRAGSRPLAFPTIPYSASCGGFLFGAPYKRSRSLRPSGLLADRTDQTGWTRGFGLSTTTFYVPARTRPRSHPNPWDRLRRPTGKCGDGALPPTRSTARPAAQNSRNTAAHRSCPIDCRGTSSAREPQLPPFGPDRITSCTHEKPDVTPTPVLPDRLRGSEAEARTGAEALSRAWSLRTGNTVRLP